MVRTSTYVRTYLPWYTCTMWYNVMSQLSDWKRAHMCTENHVCTYTCTYVHLHGHTYHWYTCTDHGTRVRTVPRYTVYQWYTYTKWYVPWYVHVYYRYTCTYTYTCTHVRTRVCNIVNTMVHEPIWPILQYCHIVTSQLFVQALCLKSTSVLTNSYLFTMSLCLLCAQLSFGSFIVPFNIRIRHLNDHRTDQPETNHNPNRQLRARRGRSSPTVALRLSQPDGGGSTYYLACL
jgi:hypothetical protein